MTQLLGGDTGPFLGMTILLGIAALLSGRAMAETWRPAWQIVPTALALAGAERFLLYALFEAKLWSIGGFAAAAVLLVLAAAASYYGARASKMVRQYPWLYDPTGRSAGARSRRTSLPDPTRTLPIRESVLEFPHKRGRPGSGQ